MTEAAANRCRRYRRRILEISRQVEAAHIAPAFSCLEIVDCLYHDVMREQDIFIMSKGHGCLAQYVILEDTKWKCGRECENCGGLGVTPLDGDGGACGKCRGTGYSGPRELDAYCKLDGALGAHPDYCPAGGIHASTGSLGHGLGIAIGQALAESLKESDVNVYVLLSDGECQSGATWEAAMVAANLGLGNLTVLVDSNGWGGMDRTDRVSGVFPALQPLLDKFRVFGWTGSYFQGHDQMGDLAAWLLPDNKKARRPRVAICATVKGHGVSFIAAGQPLWHYKSPSEEEYVRALDELEG